MAIDDRGKRKIYYVFASVTAIVIQLFLIFKASTEPYYSYFHMYTFFISVMWYVIPYFVIRTVIILLMDRYEILVTVDELISKLVDFLLKALRLIVQFIMFIITKTFKEIGYMGGEYRVRRNDRYDDYDGDQYDYNNSENEFYTDNKNSRRLDKFQPEASNNYQTKIENKPRKPTPTSKPKTPYDPFNDRYINNMIDGKKPRGRRKKPFDPFE